VLLPVLNLEVRLRFIDRLRVVIVLLVLLLIVVVAHQILLSAALLLSLFPCLTFLFLRLFLSISFVILALLLLGLFLLDSGRFLCLALLVSRLLLFPLFILNSLCLCFLSFSDGLLSALICLGGLRVDFLLFASFLSNAQDLHNVRRRVNTSGRSPEHLLQKEVCVLGFVARNNLSRLAIHLLTDDQLCQLQQFDELINLRIFISDRLPVKLRAFKQPVTVTCLLHS